MLMDFQISFPKKISRRCINSAKQSSAKINKKKILERFSTSVHIKLSIENESLKISKGSFLSTTQKILSRTHFPLVVYLRE